MPCGYVQGNNAEAARALAYLVNGNMTLSGGCPIPPPSGTLFAQQVRQAPKLSHGTLRVSPGK